ncbi:MAG: response regulator [Phycisphaera sp.]|nr:response regulator [Phycisphaera sp.]
MRTILLADDEMHVTHILSFKLKRAGVNVMTVRNGQEALAAAIKHRPDLIVTDYQMPILDGFEMSKQLVLDERTRELPVIMLTARGHKLSPSELAQTNIRALIAKPFSARDLMDKVCDVLGPLDDRDTQATAPDTAQQGS